MIEVTHMTRNSSTYSWRCSASNPGAIRATVCGAKTKSSTAAIAMTAMARVRIVRAKARADSLASALSPMNTGTNGATRPPATSTSRASSGSTNAAL